MTGKQEHSKRDQHIQKTHPLICVYNKWVLIGGCRKTQKYIQKRHGEVCMEQGVYECGNSRMIIYYTMTYLNVIMFIRVILIYIY